MAKRMKRKNEFEEELTRRPPDDLDLAALEAQILDVDDVPTTLTCLFYSEVGVGKTTLASTFPDPLILDCREKGTASIRGTGAKVVSIRTWDKLVAYYWYLRLAKHSYKTVVIDTVTQAADLAMAKVLELDEYEGLPIRKHWGQMTQLTKAQYLDFRDLSEKMNVVFNCQLKRQDEEDADERMPYSLVPALSPAVSKSLGGAVDIVGYMYVRDRKTKEGKKTRVTPERWMRITPHQDTFAKVRVPRGVIPPTLIKDPTYDKLFNVIINGKVD